MFFSPRLSITGLCFLLANAAADETTNIVNNAIDAMILGETDPAIWSAFIAEGLVPSWDTVPGRLTAAPSTFVASSHSTSTSSSSSASTSSSSSTAVSSSHSSQTSSHPTTGASTVAVIQSASSTGLPGYYTAVIDFQLVQFKFLNSIFSTTEYHPITQTNVVVSGKSTFLTTITTTSTLAFIPTLEAVSSQTFEYSPDFSGICLEPWPKTGPSTTTLSAGQEPTITPLSTWCDTWPYPAATLSSVGTAKGKLTYVPSVTSNAVGWLGGTNAAGSTITIPCSAPTSMSTTGTMAVMAICPMPSGFDS